MNARSIFIGCAGLFAVAIFTGCASGPKGNPAITSAGKGPVPKKANLLFVQNASSVSFDQHRDRMTLHGVNATTIAFADRPERFAGHMPTRNFVPMWSSGRDSFLKDPPNATLSVLDGKRVTSVVVVLRNPRLSGGDLSYDVQVLEGMPPAHGGAASLSGTATPAQLRADAARRNDTTAPAPRRVTAVDRRVGTAAPAARPAGAVTPSRGTGAEALRHSINPRYSPT